MRNEDRRVSVVIPVYNSAATLRRAVTSVLRQTLRDLEIIIVDDGSPDTSLAIARELAGTHSCIQVIALSANRGKAHALNAAIGEVRGEWIAVLDADDWYEPDRLAVLIAAGESFGADLVADNQSFWDAGANVRVRTAFPSSGGCTRLSREAFIAGSDPYADFDYGMLKPIVRAAFIRRTGLSFRENARLSEDFLYLVDFYAAGGTGALLGRPMYNWTQSFGTVSRQWTLTGAGAWRYDYESALVAHADALRDLRDAHDAVMAELLVKRMNAFRRLRRLSVIRRLRASGAPLRRVVGEIVRSPSVWPLLAERLLPRRRVSHDAASRTSPGTSGSIDNTAT